MCSIKTVPPLMSSCLLSHVDFNTAGSSGWLGSWTPTVLAIYSSHILWSRMWLLSPPISRKASSSFFLSLSTYVITWVWLGIFVSRFIRNLCLPPVTRQLDGLARHLARDHVMVQHLPRESSSSSNLLSVTSVSSCVTSMSLSISLPKGPSEYTSIWLYWFFSIHNNWPLGGALTMLRCSTCSLLVLWNGPVYLADIAPCVMVETQTS